MGVKIKEVYEYLHSIAPFHYQESYDNAGLIVGDFDQEVTGVLTCLDSTEEVIEEAIALGVNLVIAHHPIVFRGLKQFTGSNYVEKTIIKAIKNDIAILAIHTNLDNVISNGVNERIAHTIGLTNLAPLSEKVKLDHIDSLIGAGIVGDLARPMKTMDFLSHVKSKMQVGVIKYTALTCQEVDRVAVCGGVGGFLLNEAIASGAQVFITSDYKYHEFFDANDKLIIADIGHYESEQFTIQLLQELISRKFSTFAAHCTKVNTNPVNYL